jgi:hypothetical protein
MSSKHMIAVLCLGLLAAACDNPKDEAKKKQEAAEQHLTQAQIDARRKMDEAQNSAQKDMDKATGEANEKMDRASADFVKMRDDYRGSREKDLADIDKRINDLDAKASSATGAKKTDMMEKTRTLHAQRDAFAAKIRKLDTVTAAGFDDLKTDIDGSYDELKTAVRKAE